MRILLKVMYLSKVGRNIKSRKITLNKIQTYTPENQHDIGKSSFSIGKYIFKRWIFHCHVSFRGRGYHVTSFVGTNLWLFRDDAGRLNLFLPGSAFRRKGATLGWEWLGGYWLASLWEHAAFWINLWKFRRWLPLTIMAGQPTPPKVLRNKALLRGY